MGCTTPGPVRSLRRSLRPFTTLPMPPSSGLVASPPCDAVRDRVFEMLDGQLPDDVKASLRAHVEHCDACRSRLEHDARFLAALHRVREDVTAPPALRARLREELRRSAAADAAAVDPLAEVPARLTLA